MNNKEEQTRVLKDALMKFMEKNKVGELSDDALGEVAGGAVLQGWKFSVARCKKCGWVSSPFDKKGQYDEVVVGADHDYFSPNCEGDFEVFTGDTRNLLPPPQ